MTQSPQSDRRRLVEALGLGPVWVRRTEPEVVDPTGVDRESLQQTVSSGRACVLAGEDVSGAGTMRPDWLVIAAPDIDDDANDAGSAGPARRLLDAMLAAIGLSRDRTVVVTSLVKCPQHAAGTETCRASIERRIELLAPRMILVVGAVATAALFPEASDFDDFRGRPRSLTIAGRDIPVVATFHPLRLLEDGAAKAQAWADLCLARAIHQAMAERSPA